MSLLNSKRLIELQSENDELKAFIQNLTEKESRFRHFDELLKKTRVEYANLTIRKDQTTLTLNHLEKEKIKLNIQIQKLSAEIDQLRELKVYEQKQVTALNDHSEKTKTTNTNGLRFPVYKEIELAEKRKTELEEQIVNLEKRFQEVYKKVIEVEEMHAALDKEIRRKQAEIASIQQKRTELANQQLNDFRNKVTALKEEEKKNLLDIKTKVNQLSQKEIDLQKRIDDRAKQLREIEERIKHVGQEDETDRGEKILTLIVEEQKLTNSIEDKNQSLGEIEKSIESLVAERDKIIKDIEHLEELAKAKTDSIIDNAASKNVNESRMEAGTVQGVIKALREEEARLKESITQLSRTEILKRELLSELSDELAAKEIQFASIEKDYEAKSGKLKEVSIKNKFLLEELAEKTNALSITENNLKSKTSRLNQLTNELIISEKKLFALQTELNEKDNRKSVIEGKLRESNETWTKLDNYYKKVKEIVPLLEKRKEEIEQSNNAFERRFADMFQHYSTQMGEMYKKKNLLEQMVIKKEKDVNEKDQALTDKLSALEEAEKVLAIRKTEAETIEDLLKTINEQKEILSTEIKSLENSNTEKRSQNKELSIESDLYQKKLIEFENGLKEIFLKSEERFSRNTEQKEKLEGEIKEYEYRLNELNRGIKDSIDELVNLRTTINRIKVEHEEHRLSINKLVKIKNKLEEEITKHQVAIDKYTRIKEKIRQEQELIRMKREFLVENIPANQKSVKDKSFEPHNQNWIKL